MVLAGSMSFVVRIGLGEGGCERDDLPAAERECHAHAWRAGNAHAWGVGDAHA
jgi:hypothetical protein